jgi:hypothetical protein
MIARSFSIAALNALCACLTCAQEPNPCIEALPKDRLGAMYNTLLTYDTDSIKLLINEYGYERDWASHQEAVNGGWNFGDSVYGETLTRGGTFNREVKSQWMTKFQRTRHQQYMISTTSSVVMNTLDPSIIRVLNASCFSTGSWNVQTSIDPCHFTFQAGYRYGRQNEAAVTPLKLTVTNGICTGWPLDLALAPQGDSVTCTRSGQGTTTVTLLTKESGSIYGVMPAFVATIPPEPVMNHSQSVPITKEIYLYRNRDFVHAPGDIDCANGGCKELYYADFGPSEPESHIIRVTDKGCDQGKCRQWYHCGGTQDCGTVKLEFTRVDAYDIGCEEVTKCRVWSVTSDRSNNRTTIEMTYRRGSDKCLHCYPGLDYAQSHARWLMDKKRIESYSCPSFRDPAPQNLRTGISECLIRVIRNPEAGCLDTWPR